MGNNGGLLLCIIITHYYIRIMSCVHVIMSSFLHIITYYYMLLHIAAFLLLTPCVMSWQVPGPAHHIYWISQMMMFWSPIPIALWCSWPAVQFCHDGRQHTEGPAGCDYECREHKLSGLHLFFILPVSDAYAWFITPDRPWSYRSRPASNIAKICNNMH